MPAAKLGKGKEEELRLIADSTYEAIFTTAANVHKVREKSQKQPSGH